MSNKLAETMFQSGPNDDLLTVDVYDGVSNGPLNKIVESFNVAGSQAIDSIRNNPTALEDIRKVLNSASEGSLSKEEVISNLSGSLTDLRPNIKSLSGSLADTLTTNFNLDSKALSGKHDWLVSIADGIKTFNNMVGGELSSLLGITDSVSGGLLKPELINLTLESLIAGSIISDAIELGLNEIIESVLNNSKNPLIAQKASESNLERVCRSGNLDAFELITSFIGPSRCLAIKPDAIIVFLSNYDHPKDLKPTGYNAQMTRLVNTLNNINSNWYLYYRNNEWISDLTPFVKCSPDAKELFLLNDIVKDLVLIAPNYKSKKQKVIIKSFYPKISIV